MNGRNAKAIRAAARVLATGPTMWRRVNQRDKRGRVIQDSQIICSPRTFRDVVNGIKKDPIFNPKSFAWR